MYRAITWNAKGQLIATGGESLIAAWEKDDTLFIWLDCVDNDPLAEKALLKEKFNLTEFVISDAQRSRHQPKIEFTENGEFMLLKELSSEDNSLLTETIQLGVFTGPRFILTRRNGYSGVIENYWKRAVAKKTRKIADPHVIALTFAQAVSDAYIQKLLRIEDALDDIEEQMMDSSSDKLLSQLIGFQSQLRKTHRTLLYHTQIFSRQNRKLFDAKNAVDDGLWNNVYEHTERSHSLASLYYELTSDLIDGHISLSSHRLNNIMKILTIITVIFVPLSFLAGIYGMNFENMPELRYRYSYFILLGIMLTITSVLLLAFRRMKWLSS